MVYYRSFTGCLIGMGISCLIVAAIIGPGDMDALTYTIAGIIMLSLGIIGTILKYYFKSTADRRGVSYGKIKIYKRCSECSNPIVDKNLEYCPDCGNKL